MPPFPRVCGPILYDPDDLSKTTYHVSDPPKIRGSAEGYPVGNQRVYLKHGQWEEVVGNAALTPLRGAVDWNRQTVNSPGGTNKWKEDKFFLDKDQLFKFS